MFEVTGTLPKSDPAYRELEVAIGNEEADESAGVHQIDGTVTNKGDRDCEFTLVVAGFYDAEGKVIEVASRLADLQVVPAHGSSHFQVNTFYVDEAAYDHLQMWAQCGFDA